MTSLVTCEPLKGTDEKHLIYIVRLCKSWKGINVTFKKLPADLFKPLPYFRSCVYLYCGLCVVLRPCHGRKAHARVFPSCHGLRQSETLALPSREGHCPGKSQAGGQPQSWALAANSSSLGCGPFRTRSRCWPGLQVPSAHQHLPSPHSLLRRSKHIPETIYQKTKDTQLAVQLGPESRTSELSYRLQNALPQVWTLTMFFSSVALSFVPQHLSGLIFSRSSLFFFPTC